MALSFDAVEELMASQRRKEARMVLALAQALTAVAFGDRASSETKQRALMDKAIEGLLKTPSITPSEE